MHQNSMLPNSVALIDEINAGALPYGQVGVWWLGQHSFVFKVGKKILYVDPFLTPLEGRLVPPFLEPEQVRHADLIVGTHDHADHIDRPAWPILAKASPKAKFILPDLVREKLDIIPADRMIGANVGTSIELEGLTLTPVIASHEFIDQCPETGRFPYLGFVYEGHGCTWFHPGDTVWYEGLQTRLRSWSFDAMFLPINGRDARRLKMNIIGNMTYQEAVDLAGPLAPGLVFPTHYDMFAQNLGDPDAFDEYMAVKFPHVKTGRLQYGRRLLIGRERS